MPDNDIHTNQQRKHLSLDIEEVINVKSSVVEKTDNNANKEAVVGGRFLTTWYSFHKQHKADVDKKAQNDQKSVLKLHIE